MSENGVLSASHWQSVSVDNVSAFSFNSAGERPRGAGSFAVCFKKEEEKGKKVFLLLPQWRQDKWWIRSTIRNHVRCANSEYHYPHVIMNAEQIWDSTTTFLRHQFVVLYGRKYPVSGNLRKLMCKNQFLILRLQKCVFNANLKMLKFIISKKGNNVTKYMYILSNFEY